MIYAIPYRDAQDVEPFCTCDRCGGEIYYPWSVTETDEGALCFECAEDPEWWEDEP